MISCKVLSVYGCLYCVWVGHYDSIYCTFKSVCLFQDEGSKDPGQTASDAELGVQFTEIFIKKSDNVTLLLGLLEVLTDKII